ncbi:glycosyltransferase [Lichenicoccus roseus]|uniref:Glycosyltransferase n=2 Tax=Lichenicoccus roseus TaxID=2683649 RepID=A0A5R9J319_9PROT|nr:glycosyltransferase [Lichenicoccus roseus]
MAKAPRSGRSKTRLCPPLHPEHAATFSAAFLRDTTENLMSAARLAAPDVSIAPYAAFAPAECEALVASALPPGIRLTLADGTPSMPAGIEGFGRCLMHAMQAMLADGHESACVLSSDSPTLPTELLVMAARHLAEPGDRAVLGACADGGYYLLGLKAAHAAPFSDIAWSTDTVATETRARISGLGLDLIELPSWYDIDDAASLRTLLNERHGYPASHTRSAIDRLGVQRGLQEPVPIAVLKNPA